MLSALSSARTYARRVRIPNPRKGFMPIPGKNPVVCKTALEAVQCIKSNDRVFIHEIASTPHELVKALETRANELKDVKVAGFFQTKIGELLKEDDFHLNAFKSNSHFIGPNERPLIHKKNPKAITFVPMFLTEVPQHLRSPDYPIDVSLLSLSPPDKHGYCSLGPNLAAGKAGAESGKILVAEINPNVPRTLGNSFVHYSHLDYVFETNRKLNQYPAQKQTQEQELIGKHIATLIKDGDCLQAGIGGVADAALGYLKNHKNLGVHTEMFAEGMIDLIKSGAINNSKKVVKRGFITAAFAMGTERLYSEINDNPLYYFDSVDFTNDPNISSMNPNFIAINSALQVDLTGQVCADSIGSLQFSGVGGQVDFVRGASMSDGGRAIIALPATASNGKISRITTSLTYGSSVTTSRWYGVTVITEFGIADLWGLNTRQRAQALINIAHPKFREQLAKEAAELYGTD